MAIRVLERRAERSSRTSAWPACPVPAGPAPNPPDTETPHSLLPPRTLCGVDPPEAMPHKIPTHSNPVNPRPSGRPTEPRVSWNLIRHLQPITCSTATPCRSVYFVALGPQPGPFDRRLRDRNSRSSDPCRPRRCAFVHVLRLVGCRRARASPGSSSVSRERPACRTRRRLLSAVRGLLTLPAGSCRRRTRALQRTPTSRA